MKQKIIRFLLRSPIIVLCIMTACFLGFGYFSVNLFLLFKANIAFINKYGSMAIQEDAAKQLGSLILSVLISVLSYAFWKVGERLLVDWAVDIKD